MVLLRYARPQIQISKGEVRMSYCVQLDDVHGSLDPRIVIDFLAGREET